MLDSIVSDSDHPIEWVYYNVNTDLINQRLLEMLTFRVPAAKVAEKSRSEGGCFIWM